MEDNLHEWCLLEYCHMATFIRPYNLYFTNLSVTAEILFKNSEILKETNYLTENIINMNIPMDKICLLDPASNQVLEPADGDTFEYFLFGGILGDDPPRDRTAELRRLGFPTRNLGAKQMTTDTAVHVTKRIVDDKVSINQIPCIDFPEIKISKTESVIMPFRYIAIPDIHKSTLQTTNNEMKQNIVPLLPSGMFDLLKKDGDMAFEF
ncbi:SAM-dependent RNA methyltransferase [Glomus cerebriforme]|uniref:SAM-dependent RNA methyltransferase n=1 Tax=Glomus cerebriforme TaxID=658196 RepID=A0A397SM84_9GLOM|nr:SAM-dependent RNA methyltransferase [Glomus cerebriforme]